MPTKFLSVKPATQNKQWTARFHLVLNIALPIVLLLMVRAQLYELSIVLALFSKWRIFAVKPHHLIANIRSNATDIIVKLGTLFFIIQYANPWVQIGWTLWYIVWLTVLKPRSNSMSVAMQAFAAQTIGISALFLFSDRIPEVIMLALVWVIAAATSRHFLGSYDEPWARVISHLWALFVTQLAWVLNNWLLVYVAIPQLVVVITLISYVLGSIYSAYMKDKLRPTFVRQQLIMTSIVLLIVVVLADWRGEI